MSPDRQAARTRAESGGVVLVPYDPAWPARFEEASKAIRDAAGDVVVAIEHVGSTSVPGLGAKPVLDLMPGLRSFADGALLVEPMARLGYGYRGENGIPGRHYFSRWTVGDESIWKHNVHVYELGHGEWVRHLVFRDALRADAEVRAEYWRLKVTLAERHTGDVEAYAEAKSEFVERVIASAGGPSRPPAGLRPAPIPGVGR